MTVAVTLHHSGRLRLTFDAHYVDIPANADGMLALVRLLIERQCAPKARIGEQASPIQEIIDAWMQANEPSRPLQLAGKFKRRKEIEEATGVRVKETRPYLNLEGIDL